MSTRLDTLRGRPQKPSGAISYTLETGADVLPGDFMTDKAYVRELNGKLVIFREALGHGRVAVTIGGRDRVLSKAEWQKLPIHRGKSHDALRS